MSGANLHLLRPEEPDGRLLGYDAEFAVLGQCLYEPKIIAGLPHLSADLFADPLTRRMFELIERNQTVASEAVAIQVIQSLSGDPAFAQMGGARFIFDLVDKAPPIATAEDMVAVLVDLAGRRRLVEAADAARAAALDHSIPFLEATSVAEQGVAAAARYAELDAAHDMDAGDMIRDALQASLERSGVIEFPIGLADVDAKTGGLTAGEMTVLGAYTGMGKTMAGIQVAKANAAAGLGTIFYSLEMGKEPMAIRLACDVAYDRFAMAYSGRTTNPTLDATLKNRGVTDAQWARLAEAQKIVASWPLKMDCRPGLTVAQMEAAARRQHRLWRRQGIKPGPIFVDHIGKVKPSQGRRGDKTAELSDISNDLATMAKRLEVPVVALAQINREVDKQGAEDRRPQLSHIKQSGAIAEDARLVILLYRPEYYYREPMEHEDALKKAERLEKLKKVERHFYWIIAKNSNGPQGQVLTFCQAECSAIRDWNPEGMR